MVMVLVSYGQVLQSKVRPIEWLLFSTLCVPSLDSELLMVERGAFMDKVAYIHFRSGFQLCSLEPKGTLSSMTCFGFHKCSDSNL